MTKLNKLTKVYRIEFYMLEEKKVDENTTVEQRRFYISPTYTNEKDAIDKINALQQDENFIEGILIEGKQINKR